MCAPCSTPGIRSLATMARPPARKAVLMPTPGEDAGGESRVYPQEPPVEAAIRAAEDHGDFSVFHDLHAVLQNPGSDNGKDGYMLPPEPDEVVQQTFCGT